MTRALIVDVGGVLTTPVAGSFAAFCTDEGIDLDDLRAAVGELLGVGDDDHPVAQLECGRMELGPFEQWLATELNTRLRTTIAVEGCAHRLVANVALSDAMLDVVRRSRAAGIPTGLLSNSWGRTDYGALVDMFDAVVISGAEGIRKPDPEIYNLAAQRLGVKPNDCIFVDDVRRNCDGAVAVGMRAVHHTDVDATIDELEDFLGVSLR